MDMKQAVMLKPGKIAFRDVPVPDIREDEVLVKMMRIGVCGSDIHVYHGRHPYTTYPVVQGHEVSGEIIQAGAKVTALSTGDKVTIQPQVVCGKCYPCRTGNYNICDNLKVMGFQTTGMASEYFAVQAAKVLKLPEGMPYDFGAMVEPLAVAVHALGQSGMDIKGKKILVLGAGPIGNLVAQAARGLGAEAVMVTDLSEYRLNIARICGIEFAVNTGCEDLAAAIADHFGPDKADLILECVGANETMAQAIGNARKGSDIIVVGVFGEKAIVDFGLVQDRELRLFGTLMYKEADYRTAIDLISKGTIHLKPMITNHFHFMDYLKAYEFIDKARDTAMKIIIDIQDE
jgi:L-iditol 2-dehydrogenase